MADDIVTRLREKTERSLHTGSDLPSSLLIEAADEIERLRAERNKWEKLAKERNPYSLRNLVRRRYGM